MIACLVEMDDVRFTVFDGSLINQLRRRNGSKIERWFLGRVMERKRLLLPGQGQVGWLSRSQIAANIVEG